MGFEIGAVCAALRIVCLIIDNQAKETGNRFVRVGELAEDELDINKKRFVILQRSRREHYGLKDFSFMKKCSNVVDLRQRLLVTGVGAGAGQCLWANEFEKGAVCAALRIVCLIIDNQAKET